MAGLAAKPRSRRGRVRSGGRRRAAGLARAGLHRGWFLRPVSGPAKAREALNYALICPCAGSPYVVACGKNPGPGLGADAPVG